MHLLEKSICDVLENSSSTVTVEDLSRRLGVEARVIRSQCKNLRPYIKVDAEDRCWFVCGKLEAEAKKIALESKVKKGFVEAGKALIVIKTERLYLISHASFKKYVLGELNISLREAEYRMSAARVYERLEVEPEITKLPINKAQCRHLSSLNDEELIFIWKTCVKISKSSNPSARLIKEQINVLRGKKVEIEVEVETEITPTFREVTLAEGGGLEYTVKLSQETYEKLTRSREKRKSISNGAEIARLLEDHEAAFNNGFPL